MNELFCRITSHIKDRREKVLSGKVNCIPSPLVRFRKDFIGVEQGMYYLITAATKSYKSQFSSYLFLFEPIMYAFNNPTKVRLKILYFPLEETEESIVCRFICWFLFKYTNGKYHINKKDLMSTNENNPLSEDVLTLLEEDDYVKEVINFFCSSLVFYPDTNPTGIYKRCISYANENGTIHYKAQKFIDKTTGLAEVNEKTFDRYESNDNDLYTLIYIDHLALISNEGGKDQRQSMNKVSEYMVILRNRYNFTPVVIQQQAFESLDNYKLDKLRPSIAGLGDSKAPSRDANVILGLFVPFKYELKGYFGYDITQLKKYLVFLECLANRDGDSNDLIALYGDGAVSDFKELPLVKQINELKTVYDSLKKGQLHFTFFKKLFKK